jgi:flagellar FliJ protein
MTRSRRLQPVVRAVEHDERECATRLAAAERRALDAGKRREELEAYQADYASGLAERVAAGMSATDLRDYRAFLARLGEAVRAQGRLVSQANAEVEKARETWRLAAQRAKSIDHVVVRWKAEERAQTERREQIETDERALQMMRITGRHS